MVLAVGDAPPRLPLALADAERRERGESPGRCLLQTDDCRPPTDLIGALALCISTD